MKKIEECPKCKSTNLKLCRYIFNLWYECEDCGWDGSKEPTYEDLKDMRAQV